MKIIKQTLQNLEPFTPLAVVQLIQRHQASNFRNHETRVLAQRRSRLESLTHEIPETINRIRRLDRAQCTDIEFLQDEFIPSLGRTLKRSPASWKSAAAGAACSS